MRKVKILTKLQNFLKKEPVKNGGISLAYTNIKTTKRLYDVIYADPPWKYNDKQGTKGAENKYPCMDIGSIKALPVSRIAKEDCFLFLWTTFPFIKEALEVIEAWGFSYKTIGFVWVKLNKKQDTLFWGLGNYTRSNSEICLIGVKGKPKVLSKSVHSVIVSKIEEHSKKPDEARIRIKQLVGKDKKCIELFARERAKDWDCWGNDERLRK